MAKLNPNAQKWVEALRSGKYQQSRAALHRVSPCGDKPVGHCCLGVGCEVAAASGLELNRAIHGGAEFFDGDDDYLPISVQEWLGLKDNCGRYGAEVGQYLARLNDDGKTFAEIADLIEQHADELFVQDGAQ